MPSKTVYKPAVKPKEIYPGGTMTPPKFMPSYIEWLIANGQQIIISAGNSTGIFYTVPKDFTLFMVSIYVSGYKIGNHLGTRIFTSLDEESHLINATGYEGAHLCMSFSIPLKFNSNVSFNQQSDATSKDGGFVGFLIKNSDLVSI